MTHAGTCGYYMGYAWGCRKQGGVKGGICHSHPQTSGGLSGLHFLQLGLISIHLWLSGCLGYIWHWLTILLQRNSPLFPETVTFVYHNHVVQTSLLIGKSIWLHFSRASNGVQEARWWCYLGPPPRESTDAAEPKVWHKLIPKLWVLCPASLLSTWLSLRNNQKTWKEG